MEESIVPWDGVVTNPKYLLDDDHVSNGMFMIRGSFSTQPYCCIIDTRNDTWFSLDTVVWKNKPVQYEYIPSYSIQNEEKIQREERREREEPRIVFPEQTSMQPEDKPVPILPSFLNESIGQSVQEEAPFVVSSVSPSERLVLIVLLRNRELKSSEGEDVKYMQEELNRIIDNHIFITEKLQLIAQEVGV